MKVVATNRKASHDYFIEQKFEAGIKLLGTEIKSIRDSKTNINDAFIQIRNNEIFIINMHISKYDFGNLFNHEETRTRKLLMHKKEISRLESRIKEDGYSVIPLKVYIDKGLVKIEIAIAKGKKNYDKRQDLKEKDSKLRIKKVLKEVGRQ